MVLIIKRKDKKATRTLDTASIRDIICDFLYIKEQVIALEIAIKIVIPNGIKIINAFPSLWSPQGN